MSWDKLSMSERADIIKLAVQSGIKDLYAIRDTYNEFAKGGKKKSGTNLKQNFLTSLDQSLREDATFNTPQYRQFFTDLARQESGYYPTITNSIGAKGYFQLMPGNRSASWSNPTQQFHETYKLVKSNIDYFNKKLTKKDWDRARELGIDMYGLLGGAHLGGVGGVVRALRGKGNAKDMNGSSVLGYMRQFSQSGKPTTYTQAPQVSQEASIAAPIPSTTNSDESYNFLEVPQLTSLPPTTYTFGSLPTVEDIARQTALEPPTPEELRRQERHEKLERFQNVMGLMSRIQPSVQSSHLGNIASVLGQQSSAQYFSDGGSIYIKPSHRGRFTELKERTGHSASWFKKNGTPAQKKMATFALNARHWKHGLGGNLFGDGGNTKAGIPVDYLDPSEVMPLVADNMGKSIVLDEQVVTPYKKLPMQSDFFEGETNQAANEKADEFANRTSLTPERFVGLTAASVPLAAGALGAVVTAPIVGNALMGSVVNPVSDYIGGTAAGQMITRGLSNPYVSKGIEAAFAGHGLNHAINEGIDGYGDAAMTALEISPLGGLAKPMMNAGRNSLGLLKDNAKAFYNNLTMDLNSVPGSFYHGSPSRTIEEFIPGKDGGIYFTPTKRAARGYTGNLGTGRVYEANLNLGDNPVVVDAGGKAWNAIPEEAVAKAFGMPKEKVYEQIGHYNAGAEPWYSDFLKPFGYSPNTRSYAVDQIVTLGKDLGKSSLTIKGAKDSGKGLFGWKQLPYDQTIVYQPEQISLLKPAPQITAESAASITPEQSMSILRGDSPAEYVSTLYNYARRKPISFAEKQAAANRMETFIHSPEYIQAQKKAGLNDSEIASFQDMVARRLNGGNFPAYTMKTKNRGLSLVLPEPFGGVYVKKGIPEDDFLNVFDHEVAHYSTVNYNKSGNKHVKWVNREDPSVVEKIMNHNINSVPYRPKSDVSKIRAARGLSPTTKNLDYFRNEQELRSNAYSMLQEAKRRGVSVDDLVDRYTMQSTGEIFNFAPAPLKYLNYAYTPDNMKKFIKGFLSLSTPATLGIKYSKQDD